MNSSFNNKKRMVIIFGFRKFTSGVWELLLLQAKMLLEKVCLSFSHQKKKTKNPTTNNNRLIWQWTRRQDKIYDACPLKIMKNALFFFSDVWGNNCTRNRWAIRHCYSNLKYLKNSGFTSVIKWQVSLTQKNTRCCGANWLCKISHSFQ